VNYSVLYIYLLLFSTSFGHPCAHHQVKISVSMRHWYLSLCLFDIWSARWNPTSRPYATHTEWQIPVSHRYSNFLLMMGTWMPERCREEK